MSFPIMNYFVFDGADSREWNIGLSGSGVYNAPARDVTVIDIPGRSGRAVLDNGRYLNTSVVYPCWIAKGFDEEIDDFRAFLSDHSGTYYRLEDSYHPDEYRMGRYVGPFDAVPGTRNKSGRFEVEFDCKPQRYLKEGEKWTEEKILFNPTRYPSRPTFRVYSTGSINFTGGNAVTVLDMNSQDYLDIDTELYTAYKDDVFYPNAVVFNVFEAVFAPGENTIDTDMSKVETRPNWWTL